MILSTRLVKIHSATFPNLKVGCIKATDRLSGKIWLVAEDDRDYCIDLKDVEPLELPK